MSSTFPLKLGVSPTLGLPKAQYTFCLLLPPHIPLLVHARYHHKFTWRQNASLYVISATGMITHIPPRTTYLSCSRLYFTTFPHPPPKSEVLNKLAAEPGNQPRVRACPRGGPSASPDDNATYYYFTIDDQLLYLSFFQDWGPLNIAMVYKACIYIHELLEVYTLSQRPRLMFLTCTGRTKT